MKISISIGTQAKESFEAVIEAGAVVGLSLDGQTLTFDYTGLDNNEALQRAVDNQTSVTDKVAEFVAADNDELAGKFNYVLGYMAVATANLATEQAVQTGLYASEPVAADPAVNAPLPTEPYPEPVSDAPSPAPRKRSKDADATIA